MKQIAMTKNPNNIFCIALLLAVFIHAILLSAIKVTWPHQLTSSMNQTLIVSLLKPQKNSAQFATENITVSNKNNTATKVHKTKVVPVKTRSQEPFSEKSLVNLNADSQSNSSASALEINQQTSAPKEEAKPAANLERIMESAREIARQEAHQLEENEPSKDLKEKDNIISAAIGNAFKQPEISRQQKIKSYADGMIEVTNTDGSKYCITPPQNFQRGGPVEAQSIPMTCR
jgi:hypothetical protein